MAVAYTTPLSRPTPVDFDKTLGSLQVQAQLAQRERRAALAQKRAAQKEAGERLSNVVGYDITTVPLGMQPVMTEMWTDLVDSAPALLESDDPVALEKRIQSFTDSYSKAQAQLKDETLKDGMMLLQSLATNDAELNDYNEELSAFERVDDNLQAVYDQRDNAYQGLDKEWDYRMVDGRYEIVFNQGLEGGGVQQLPLSEWENYLNPSLADVPTVIGFRQEPSSVGVNNVRAGMETSGFDWSEATARERSTDVVLGNSLDGKDMRAYTAFTYFTNDMQQNPDVMTPFAAGNMRDPIFFDVSTGEKTTMGKQVDEFLNKTIDIMVESSKYAKEQEEETQTAGQRNQEVYLNSMRREQIPLGGLVVAVDDPAAGQDVAVDRFAGRVGELKGNGQAYTLTKPMTITNFLNPIFGMTDPEYGGAIEGSEDQVIKLENVRKVVAFGPQEGYPQGGIVLRDFSYKNKAYPFTVLDNNIESQKTAIDQILQELRTQTGLTGVEISNLIQGWDAVKVRERTDSPTGGRPR